MGIARKDVGDNKLTAEERTECILDLHGLHSNEATEVLEHFLLSVGLLFLFFSRLVLTLPLFSWRMSTFMDWVRDSVKTLTATDNHHSLCHCW